jgi:hypothetical protein
MNEKQVSRENDGLISPSISEQQDYGCNDLCGREGCSNVGTNRNYTDGRE